MLVIAGTEDKGLLRNTRISIGCLFFGCLFSLVWIPVTQILDLIRSAKGSITSANNNGDKGHPCFVPLLFVK